ncbi:circularly permuted type 2 ATP-grasp protein [Tessaracoccus sp. G1721]
MTAEAAPTTELADYRRRAAGGWDELTSGARPDQLLLHGAIESLGLPGLQAAGREIQRLVEDEGILYGGESRRSWVVDPLPLILGADEWDALEAGLKQRTRLLGLVLRDLYGEQRLLSSGALPAEIVWGHQGFLHQASGIHMPGHAWLPLAAVDLGRDSTGAWTVLADRTDAPSGMGYVMANRRLTSRVMADLHHDARPARLRSYFSAMRAGLQQLAPRAGHTPKGVLLWAGAGGETAYEQGFLATLLGYALVEAEDLVLRDGQVWVNSPEGRALVDVILRRVDSNLCDPLEFRSDSQLGVAGLLEATRLGNVASLNPLGSGVLENPALLGLLPALAPQLLGEELLLPSAQTWWCGDDAQRSHVLANLDTMLLKPLSRGLGAATLAGWELAAAQKDQLAARIAAEPWAWCGQDPLDLSTTPVVTDDALEPRRVVLRCFAAQVDHSHEILAGGLARVARDDRFRITTMSGALTKDVWVLDPEDVQETWTPTFDGGPIAIQRVATLAPRVADNLYWFGRYTERADGTVRLLRLAVDLAHDHGRSPASRGGQVLAAVLAAGEGITDLDLSSRDVGGALKRLRPAVVDGSARGSVAHAVRRLTEAAQEVPDIMSGDLWHVLSQLSRLLGEAGRRRDLAGVLDDLVAGTLAIAGINNESLTRDVTWAFVDAGVRIERAQRMLAVVEHTLGADRAAVVENQLADAVLEMGESLITQRRRSASGEGPRRPALAATQLLICDRSNPRSVAYQLDRLVEDLRLIGDEELAARAADLVAVFVSADVVGLFAGPRALVAGFARTELSELRAVSDELTRRHLTRSAPRRATLSEWSAGTMLGEDA